MQPAYKRHRWAVIGARWRLAFKVPLDTDQEKSNYRTAVIEGCLATLTVQVAATFAPVYALELGATNGQLGLFYSLPFLFNIIALLVANRFIAGDMGLVRLGQGAAYVHRVLILLLAATPLLSPYGVWWIVALYSVASGFMAVSSVFWQGIVSDMFPESKRGTVFGTRHMFTGAVGLIAVMTAGQLLDMIPAAWNFSFVLGGAGVLGFVAAYYYGLLVPPEDPTAQPRIDGVSDKTSPRRLKVGQFLRTEQGKRFGALTLTVALFTVGFHMSAPIVTIYFVDGMHLSKAAIGLLTSVAVLFQVIGSRVWGGWIDGWGNGTVLLLTTALLGLQVTFFAAVPSLYFLFIVQALGGFALGGHALATMNTLFTMGDRQYRAQLIVWYNVVMGLAAFGGPQIGTALLGVLSLGWVFALSGTIRLAAAVWMMHMARNNLLTLSGRRGFVADRRRGKGSTLRGR